MTELLLLGMGLAILASSILYRWLRINLYLVRVPIFAWAAPAILVASLFTETGHDLMRNLFIVPQEWGAFGISFFALILGYSAYATATATAEYGSDRFRLPVPTPQRTLWKSIFFSAVPWLVFIIAVLVFTVQELDRWPSVQWWLFVVLGGLAATVAQILAEWMGTGLRTGLTRLFPRLLQRLDSCSPPVLSGYLETEKNQTYIRKRHLSNLLLAVITLVIYLFFAHPVGRTLLSPESVASFDTPALLFLLAGTAFVCYLAAGAAFFLDRYRVPLLGVLILMVLLAGYMGDTEHYFAAQPQPNVEMPTASDLLARGDRAILVAAEGGGIQAAGWTVRVLTGLSDIEGFRSTVRLVSGVSGGAVGALYFLRTYSDTGPNALRNDEAFRLSVAPNLAAVAWGLIHIDLRHMLFPYYRNPLIDRGWALERSLSKRAQVDRVFLSTWAPLVRDGFLPGAIFNVTEVETGLPLVMSTTALGKGNPWLRSFVEDDELDVPIATAARLSSGFPLVSPAARPVACQPTEPCHPQAPLGPHLVDGGYYDNAGIYSLLVWLDSAQQIANRPRILVVRIESLPKTEKARHPPVRSWAYQLKAPFSTLLNVRSTAQKSRNLNQLDLYNRTFPFEQVVCSFDPPKGCEKPSLSWNLSSSEVTCLHEAWKKIKGNGSGCYDVVEAFLRP